MSRRRSTYADRVTKQVWLSRERFYWLRQSLRSVRTSAWHVGATEAPYIQIRGVRYYQEQH